MARRVSAAELSETLVGVLLHEVEKPSVTQIAKVLGLKLPWFRAEKSPPYVALKDEWLFLVIFLINNIGFPSAQQQLATQLESSFLATVAARLSIDPNEFRGIYQERVSAYADVVHKNDADQFLFPQLAAALGRNLGQAATPFTLTSTQLGLKINATAVSLVQFIRGFSVA